jgi:hypothetical protein
VLVKVQSDKESVKGNVEFAINRLLNGQMVLGWLVEKIRTSEIAKQDLQDVLDKFRQNYADNIIFIDIEKACRQNGFI